MAETVGMVVWAAFYLSIAWLVMRSVERYLRPAGIPLECRGQ